MLWCWGTWVTWSAPPRCAPRWRGPRPKAHLQEPKLIAKLLPVLLVVLDAPPPQVAVAVVVVGRGLATISAAGLAERGSKRKEAALRFAAAAKTAPRTIVCTRQLAERHRSVAWALQSCGAGVFPGSKWAVSLEGSQPHATAAATTAFAELPSRARTARGSPAVITPTAVTLASVSDVLGFTRQVQSLAQAVGLSGSFVRQHRLGLS